MLLMRRFILTCFKTSYAPGPEAGFASRVSLRYNRSRCVWQIV